MKGARVLAWIALYAAALRAFGGAVGIWAAGSLTVVGTVFVGVVIPIGCFLFAPTWLAWRIVHPLAGSRARRVVLSLCWLSPLVRAGELAGMRVFVDALAGQPLPMARRGRVDVWTALAALAEAQRQGDAPRADRILDALAHLPLGSRFSWAARVWGADALVEAALARRDWAAAARVARIGAGRLCRIVDTLAAAGAGDGPGRFALWASWLFSPTRRGTLGAVRAAARTGGATPTRLSPPDSRIADAGPRLQHLRLLDAAERGPIRLAEVFALADAWQHDLDEAALARLRARGLELGVRDGEARARALRDAVLDELTDLAVLAEGHPVSAPTLTPLGRELARRLRERMVGRVEVALERLGRRPASEFDSLDVWERWLELRDAVEALEQRAGSSGLGGLWYSGVRDAVWGTGFALCEPERPRSPWAAHMMFSWIADRAELLGDVPAMLANRENARRALTRQ